MDTKQLEQGIPADAYKASSGDDKKVCTDLKKQNTQAGKKLAISLRMIPQTFNEMESMPEDTVEQVEAKRKAFAQAQAGQGYQNDRLKEDLFTAAFFAPKTPDTAYQVPTNSHLRLIAEGQSLPEPVLEITRELASTHRFLHWPLAFPQIFGEDSPGGFDVMLGNPPWERIKLQEQEFFASRAPDIATARNSSARGKMIAALAESDSPNMRNLHRKFLAAKQNAEGSSAFARLSGRFPLTGRGDVNLYALFAEHFAKSINPRGRSGVIVPTGIATDDSTKFFFGWLGEGQRLASLYDFENREKIFPAVDSRMKFCLLTMGKGLSAADLSFFLTQTTQLADPRRHFTLTPEEFALINPNTKTCPVFRAQRDAEVTKKMYQTAPVLIREAGANNQEVNPWSIRFQTMFHMSNDSHLFKTADEIENFQESLLPLYEAKMVHHYDHRWSTYELDGESSRDCTLEEKQNPNYRSRPRYWVPEEEVILRTAQAPKRLIDAWKSSESETLKHALTMWLAGGYLERRDTESAELLLGEAIQNDNDDFFDASLSLNAKDALAMHRQYPLKTEEHSLIRSAIDDGEDLWHLTRTLLNERRPEFLLGYRNICRTTDERTVISAIFPFSAVGHSMPIIQPKNFDRNILCLVGLLSSIPFDYVARQKLGGTNLTFGYIQQFPAPPPEAFDRNAMDFIIPRVLKLISHSVDLKNVGINLGCSAELSPFDPPLRHQLKCELDAYYAKLYCLTRDELRYVLDPADVMGAEYPSETFRVLKKNEIREFGEYRTQRLVLEAWDKLVAGELQ